MILSTNWNTKVYQKLISALPLWNIANNVNAISCPEVEPI